MEKILIIQQKMIGDVLTSTILFEALRKKYPAVELHYLINAGTAAVVENHPYIDKLVILDSKSQNSMGAIFGFFKKIKTEKYDLVIDLYSKFFSAGVSFFSGAKKRIGKKKWYLAWAYTDGITLTPHSPQVSIPMAFLNRFDFLKPIMIGDEIDFDIKPRIFVSENERKSMSEKLQTYGLGDNLIMVNCLGSSDSKTYPMEYMARLLEFTVANFPEKTLLLNFAPNQKQEAEKLISLCDEKTRRAIPEFHAHGLREFIVLTTFCEAVIGNEGGAINIAKALKIKTWCIFSPWIKPESWMHKNAAEDVAIHLKYFRPELFSGHEKHTKKRYQQLYALLKPALLFDSLKSFLNKI